jgi:hypothetical protein
MAQRLQTEWYLGHSFLTNNEDENIISRSDWNYHSDHLSRANQQSGQE